MPLNLTAVIASNRFISISTGIPLRDLSLSLSRSCFSCPERIHHETWPEQWNRHFKRISPPGSPVFSRVRLHFSTLSVNLISLASTWLPPSLTVSSLHLSLIRVHVYAMFSSLPVSLPLLNLLCLSSCLSLSLSPLLRVSRYEPVQVIRECKSLPRSCRHDQLFLLVSSAIFKFRFTLGDVSDHSVSSSLDDCQCTFTHF